jgi:hypothetical protein
VAQHRPAARFLPHLFRCHMVAQQLQLSTGAVLRHQLRLPLLLLLLLLPLATRVASPAAAVAPTATATAPTPPGHARRPVRPASWPVLTANTDAAAVAVPGVGRNLQCALVLEDGSPVRLRCNENQHPGAEEMEAVITAVTFASWGQPAGSCGQHAGGEFTVAAHCHTEQARRVVEQQCVGRTECTVRPENAQFVEDGGGSGDPCHGRRKWLAVVVECAAAAQGTTLEL